jgi:hypothetical protein
MGAKLWLIGANGSATPFWDQWDSEAAFLYKPYLEGTLRVSDLFLPHSEHRIFFTRLLALTLLELNGYWDTVLQMAINTVIHVASIAVLLILLGRALQPRYLTLLAVFTSVLFAIPFGWENSLSGFHSSWYLFLLFTLLCFLMFHGAAAFSSRWWLGIVLTFACFFSLASGALTLVSIVVVLAFQFVLGGRCGQKEVLGIVLLTAVTMLLFSYVPVVHGHEPLKAKTIVQFLTAFLTTAGWPFTPATNWTLLSGLLGVLVLNAPILLLGLRLIKVRPAIDDPKWIYLGLAGWGLVQSASLAYGRADPVVVASRYIDLLAVMMVVNFAALLLCVVDDDQKNSTRVYPIGAAVWIFAITPAIASQAFFRIPAEIADKRITSEIQTLNLKNFLETGDFSHLSNKPHLDIPYPLPERLRQIVSDPTVRSILPPSLGLNRDPFGETRPKLALRQAAAGATARFKQLLLLYGPFLTPAGVAIFFLIGLYGPASRTTDSYPQASSI